ncbi:translocator protein 2 [Phodopus roborovskii]|uniref:Tspo2 protein n=1 Tax=Phodopus roborovskii TaxID=109678 RepID=A0AAV0A4V6_PHORO|nr:translocator protein 2 [Phodopus roborovskii]CAH7209807.1 Tspo2 [Phodopus roborovskii]
MQPQGSVFVGVPLLGPILICMFTHNQTSGWCEEEGKLWCPPRKVILIVWATIYSVIGYSSYLVWKDLGGGFRWPLVLPLGLYTFQLTLSWTFLMLFLTANNPGLALLDLLLLYGLVASMVLIWQPINKLAALLLLPYLAWLTVTGAITYRLWRDSLCPAYQPLPSEKSN